jgi:hypothetical protein
VRTAPSRVISLTPPPMRRTASADSRLGLSVAMRVNTLKPVIGAPQRQGALSLTGDPGVSLALGIEPVNRVQKSAGPAHVDAVDSVPLLDEPIICECHATKNGMPAPIILEIISNPHRISRRAVQRPLGAGGASAATVLGEAAPRRGTFQNRYSLACRLGGCLSDRTEPPVARSTDSAGAGWCARTEPRTNVRRPMLNIGRRARGRCAEVAQIHRCPRKPGRKPPRRNGAREPHSARTDPVSRADSEPISQCAPGRFRAHNTAHLERRDDYGAEMVGIRDDR